MSDIFGNLAGHKIAGGCDDCDAFQKVIEEATGVWIIRIFHDDWCPTLAHYERSRP